MFKKKKIEIKIIICDRDLTATDIYDNYKLKTIDLKIQFRNEKKKVWWEIKREDRRSYLLGWKWNEKKWKRWSKSEEDDLYKSYKKYYKKLREIAKKERKYKYSDESEEILEKKLIETMDLDEFMDLEDALRKGLISKEEYDKIWEEDREKNIYIYKFRYYIKNHIKACDQFLHCFDRYNWKFDFSQDVNKIKEKIDEIMKSDDDNNKGKKRKDKGLKKKWWWW
jgi:hypothetical protein